MGCHYGRNRPIIHNNDETSVKWIFHCDRRDDFYCETQRHLDFRTRNDIVASNNPNATGLLVTFGELPWGGTQELLLSHKLARSFLEIRARPFRGRFLFKRCFSTSSVLCSWFRFNFHDFRRLTSCRRNRLLIFPRIL